MAHRWWAWPWNWWSRRRRAAALAAAAAADEAERQAALRRVLEMATVRLPTVPYLRRPENPGPRYAPLLTPGQAARTRRNAR